MRRSGYVAFPEAFDFFAARRFAIRGFSCFISFSSSPLGTERRASSRRIKAIDSGDGRVGPVSISQTEANLRPPGDGTLAVQLYTWRECSRARFACCRSGSRLTSPGDPPDKKNKRARAPTLSAPEKPKADAAVPHPPAPTRACRRNGFVGDLTNGGRVTYCAAPSVAKQCGSPGTSVRMMKALSAVAHVPRHSRKNHRFS